MIPLFLPCQFNSDFLILGCLLTFFTFSYSWFLFEAVENPGSDNLKSLMIVPPPTVLDRVFKDLFHEGAYFVFGFAGGWGSAWFNSL